MSLPNFPTTLLTRDAKRIQDFFSDLEKRLLHQYNTQQHPLISEGIVVYGSCAVSLYLADEQQTEVSMTDDIDIDTTDTSSANLLQDCSPHTQPPLEIRQRCVENWLIHPDWRERVVNVTLFLGLSSLHIFLLHPMDLILTKLGRYKERDIEDCIRLNARYIHDYSFFKTNLDEAMEYLIDHQSKKKMIRTHALIDLYDQED
jgi:hypothetical protein